MLRAAGFNPCWGAYLRLEKIRAIYPQPVGSPPDRRIELMNEVLKEAINRRERMIAQIALGQKDLSAALRRNQVHPEDGRRFH